MSNVPASDFVPPDPRDYMTAGAYLTAWCAAQPERKIQRMIEELAGYAGCSDTTMHYVIHGPRDLRPALGRDLASRLGLPPEQVDHLVGLFELPFAPPRLARARREKLLRAMADARGLPQGTSSALLEDTPSDDAVVAALAPALASLEDDRPTLPRLLRAVVPPVSMAQLQRGAAAPVAWTRRAPRMMVLDAPGATPGSAAGHMGVLSFAQEAMMRLSSRERDLRTTTATVDDEALSAWDLACRRRADDAADLCHDGLVRVPNQVQMLCAQRLVLAGPLLAGGSGGEARWREGSFQLPLLEVAPHRPTLNTEDPARPHPAGLATFPTWVKIWRAWATRVGQPCSDSWLSEQTELPRSTIYDLCTGTSKFSSEHVYRFLKPFGLEDDPVGQTVLEGMAMVAAPEDPRWQAQLIAALRGMGIARGARHHSTEAHFVLSKWYAQAVYCLPHLGGFRPLSGWISRTLKGRVTWNVADDTLRALAAVGLLGRDASGNAVVVDQNVRVEGPLDALAQYELHHSQLQLYQAELDQRDPDLTLHACALGLSDKGLPRLAQIDERFDNAVRDAIHAAGARRRAGAPMNRVVIFSHQRFPLFRLKPTPRGSGAPRKAPSKPATGA